MIRYEVTCTDCDSVDYIHHVGTERDDGEDWLVCGCGNSQFEIRIVE